MLNIFNIRPKGLNVGNDLIALALQRYLHDAFEQVVNVITLPATSKYEGHVKAGLDARTIYEINQYGHGVIVGGGNLYENGELDVDLEALKSLDPPLMLFSLSRGRVYGRRGELTNRTDAMPDSVIAALNSRANYSLARDQATLEHLHSVGADHAVLGGCPTLFLDEAVLRELPPLAERDRGLVFVSVRNPNLMSIPLDKQSMVRSDIIAIIAMLQAEYGDRVRVLCHDYRDISFAASLRDVEYVYCDDVRTYLALLCHSAHNVSYRLHSALPCFALGRPCITISYDERALSVMESIGYGDWNIDMMRCNDVPAAVAERQGLLQNLPVLKATTNQIWHDLDQTMSKAISSFAADAMAFHRIVG